MIITNNKAYLIHEEDKTPHAFTQTEFDVFIPAEEAQNLEKIYVPQDLLSQYQELNEFFASRMETYNFVKRVTKPEYYYFDELTLTDGVMRKVLDGSVINTVKVPMVIRKGYNMYHFPFDITREELEEVVDLGSDEVSLPDDFRDFSVTQAYSIYSRPIPNVIRANVPFLFKSNTENTTTPLVFHNKTLKILQKPLLYRMGQTNWFMIAHSTKINCPTEESHLPIYACGKSGNYGKVASSGILDPFRVFIEEIIY